MELVLKLVFFSIATTVSVYSDSSMSIAGGCPVVAASTMAIVVSPKSDAEVHQLCWHHSELGNLSEIGGTP